MAEQRTINRTGQAPLKFNGELLAESEGRIRRGKENNRWHDLYVFRTDSGKYVVNIEYHTQWQGEESHDFADVVADAKVVESVFREYEPTRFVGGYPPGDAYAERQSRMLSDIRLRYESQVGELLSEHDDFAERI